MESSTPTMSSAPTFKKAGLRETTVLLALAWLVPFAVHLIPWAGPRPLGAWLMPALWTALVAVYFYGEVVGLITALASPLLNLIVTGAPAGGYFWKTSVEAVVFTLLVAWAVRRKPGLLAAAAPLAYAVAKPVAAAIFTPEALFGSAEAFRGFFEHMLLGNWPGLLVLAVMGAGLARVERGQVKGER